MLLSVSVQAWADGTQSALKTPSFATGVGFSEQYHNRQIALWSLQQINASLPLVDDPWVVQVLYDMTVQMNALVRTQPIVAVPVIADTQINAFAVTGGVIGLNAGVVLSAKSLDEVASVLAHEIAHLSQRHYEHRMENNKKLMALQMGGLLTAIAASAVSGDAALLTMAGTQTLGAENAAAHSREHEREADRVGQQILAQAGYDPHAMPRFFGQLYKHISLNQAKNAFAPSFMQSHPFTMERLSESTTRASSYPAVSAAQKQAHAQVFDLLYWRLRYLTQEATLADLSVHAMQSKGAALALAMYYMDNHQTDKAQKILNQAKFSDDEVLPAMVQAELFASNHRYDEAVRQLAPLQKIYPERRDVRLELARHLIHAGKADEALVLVEPLLRRNAHDLQAWRLVWRAYEGRSSQQSSALSQEIANVYALQARSQVELWSANYDAALQSNAQAIKFAQSQPKLNTFLLTLQKDKAAILAAREFKIK